MEEAIFNIRKYTKFEDGHLKESWIAETLKMEEIFVDLNYYEKLPDVELRGKDVFVLKDKYRSNND